MRSFKRHSERGFTFVEVLVAMVILVLAIISSVRIAQGSVAAVRDSREMSVATWLVQNKMVELETQMETEGMDKGCDKKKEGKFEAPYERYSWVTTCDEIDLNLSESASKLLGETEDSAGTQENVIKKMILTTVSDYMSKSLRELHTEVFWLQGKTRKKVTLTTHFARYDEKFSLPGLPTGGGT